MKKPLFLIIIALLGAGSFWYWRSAHTTDTPNEIGGAGIPQIRESRFPGWNEYRNQRFEFVAFYPQELAVKEVSEKGGAMTITFENEQAGEGFQVFALPYSGTQVSEERFRQDVPSGVRNSPKDLRVAGAVATAFYSEDSALGETYEIWFLHEGFLYELTTLKSLEPLLNTLAERWQFLERGIR